LKSKDIALEINRLGSSRQKNGKEFAKFDGKHWQW
jgi:hypothetical protein